MENQFQPTPFTQQEPQALPVFYDPTNNPILIDEKEETESVIPLSMEPQKRMPTIPFSTPQPKRQRKMATSISAPALHICTARCAKLSSKAAVPKNNRDVLCLGGNVGGNLYIMSQGLYTKMAEKNNDIKKRAQKLVGLLFDNDELATSSVSGGTQTYANKVLTKKPLCTARLEVLKRQLFEDFPILALNGNTKLPQLVVDAINTRCRGQKRVVKLSLLGLNDV